MVSEIYLLVFVVIDTKADILKLRNYAKVQYIKSISEGES